MEDRFYTDQYDLYRPTVATSSSREQSLTVPDTATTESLRCLYFPTPGRFQQRATGIDLEYDAVLLVPDSHDLRPSKLGEQPDQIEIDSRRYDVLICWPMAGKTLGKKALLKETR